MQRPEKSNKLNGVHSKRAGKPINESLNKRLAVYALAATAAGVGALALAQPANADIVVTTENPALVINSTHTPETLTIEGSAELHFFETLRVASSGIFVSGLNGAKVLAFNSFGASMLAVGSAIGPHRSFRSKSPSGSALVMGGTLRGAPPSLAHIGLWTGEKGYLGFDFAANGKTYFGWAKMSFSANGKSAKLTEYAYDDIAGQTILAGEKPAPPTAAEPGALTLSLLALGALGLDALRRRRKAFVAQRS